MSKVVIIGGGPAGMAAAIAAAKAGHTVTIVEKNEKLGKKLFITGKGRCNITNACDTEDLFQSVPRNAKFLYSAFYGFSNQDVMDFFEENGLPIKVERGNRVFPVSDHSSDVIATLTKVLKQLKVEIKLYSEVKRLLCTEEGVSGVELKDGTKLLCDDVIVATGGVSYESTGSTGDGYIFAKECGHGVTQVSPSLVPMTAKEEYVMGLQGLSLKNVSVKILDGKKKLYEDFGEMLFTHFGVSGPLIISASSLVPHKYFEKELSMTIDLKPALDEEQLDARVLRDFNENTNRQFKNAIVKLFPGKMVPVMITLSGIDPEKKVHDITKEERRTFVSLIKNFPVTITGLREFKEAIITRGGVSVKEVNPSTMESKQVPHLYFAGEVLDLDALTGGFNLQIAWSTGYLAGSNIQ